MEMPKKVADLRVESFACLSGGVVSWSSQSQSLMVTRKAEVEAKALT